MVEGGRDALWGSHYTESPGTSLPPLGRGRPSERVLVRVGGAVVDPAREVRHTAALRPEVGVVDSRRRKAGAPVYHEGEVDAELMIEDESRGGGNGSHPRSRLVSRPPFRAGRPGEWVRDIPLRPVVSEIGGRSRR